MKLCLVGEKLSHSYSKEIHNLMGLDYSHTEVERGKLKAFVENNDYSGYNVTIPYKKEIIPYLDYVDASAQKVGAINVVNVVDGKRYGYNTDISGMEYMIKRKGVSVYNKCVLVLGTGGTSNTALTLMNKLGAKKVTVVGRTSPVNYENCYELTGTQIIINTTPVGMTPDLLGKAVDIKRFPNLIAVFDAVYNPQRTAIVREALSLNLVASSGLPMLVEQALCGEDIWLNKTHTECDSENMIFEIAKRKLNIALTGMPSSGKSTVGKLLAKRLNRPFFDVDDEVYAKTSKTPAEIIKTQGESVFRQIESEVVKELSAKSGAVIALGGGSILSKENRECIASNCVSVYIKRDLSLLKTNGRPISQEKGVEKLYNERKAFYESANVTVLNNEQIENTVKEIIEKYEIACSKWS
ncbi:MAG: shikimate dehydrogenase [Clostridia bacterium]|nr:shikimate dehydrogenase [Clostridia bacterium]